MKVIFLDIDGVLNNEKTEERFGSYIGVDAGLLGRFQGLMQLLPEVEVVLSSTWRLHEAHKAYLKGLGLSWVSETPVLGYRGVEINAWLKEHPEVTDYVILDDMAPNHFLPDQLTHFIRTSERNGLTSKDAWKVIFYFNLINYRLNGDDDA